MEHSTIAPEVTFEHHHSDEEFKKRVRKTTIILSILTAIELGIGLTIYTIHKGESPNAILVLMFKSLFGPMPVSTIQTTAFGKPATRVVEPPARVIAQAS